MGIFDHAKTFRYRVTVPHEQAVHAFVDAFSSGGGLVARAHWKVRRTADGAVASYAGRKGLVGVMTAMSSRASAEQDGAIGSEVIFKQEERGAGYAVYAMWLASSARTLGFTSDGRFFRPYMRAVEDRLRAVDPSMQMMKS
jgi:hypothetical protein